MKKIVLMIIAMICILGTSVYAEQTDEVNVPIRCVVEGQDEQTDAAYIYEVKAEENAPCLQQDAILLHGNESSEITLELSEVGTYEYKVSLRESSNPDADRQQYTIRIVISNENGRHERGVVILTETGTKTDAIIFSQKEPIIEVPTETKPMETPSETIEETKPNETEAVQNVQDSVDTGDHSAVMVYTSALLLSATALIFERRRGAK